LKYKNKINKLAICDQAAGGHVVGKTEKRKQLKDSHKAEQRFQKKNLAIAMGNNKTMMTHFR